MAHIHSVYDSDTHFSINPVTRALKSEAKGRVSLIQYDHNSQRITFEVPRYIEGHDMSLCNVVQVHYNNIDARTKEQNKGVYDVDDMHVSAADNAVVCSWLISRNATQLAGSLNFLLRFACVSGGNVEYEWNTAIYSGVSVSDGINNGDVIAEEYADILEQWRNELFETDESGAFIVHITATSEDGNTFTVVGQTPNVYEVYMAHENGKNIVGRFVGTRDSGESPAIYQGELSLVNASFDAQTAHSTNVWSGLLSETMASTAGKPRLITAITSANGTEFDYGGVSVWALGGADDISLAALNILTLDEWHTYRGKEEVNIHLPVIKGKVPWSGMYDPPFADYAEERTILDNVTLTFADGMAAITDDDPNIELDEGAEYTVVYNGKTYNCGKPFVIDHATFGIGNIGIMTGEEGNSMPFLIAAPGIFEKNPEFRLMVVSADESATLTIKASPYVKKIHPKFVSSMPYSEASGIPIASTANKHEDRFFNSEDGIQYVISVPAADAAYGAAVEFYTASGELACYMWLPGMIDTSAKYAKVTAKREHGEWTFEATNPVGTQNYSATVQKNANFVSGANDIGKVIIYAASGGMFPAGTIFESRKY